MRQPVSCDPMEHPSPSIGRRTDGYVGLILASAKTFLGQHALVDVVYQRDAGAQYKANLVEQSTAVPNDPRRRVVATGKAFTRDDALLDLLDKCSRRVDHRIASSGWDFPTFGKVMPRDLYSVPPIFASESVNYGDDNDSVVSYEAFDQEDLDDEDIVVIQAVPFPDSAPVDKPAPTRVTTPATATAVVPVSTNTAAAAAAAAPAPAPIQARAPRPVPCLPLQTSRPQSMPISSLSKANIAQPPESAAANSNRLLCLQASETGQQHLPRASRVPAPGGPPPGVRLLRPIRAPGAPTSQCKPAADADLRTAAGSVIPTPPSRARSVEEAKEHDEMVRRYCQAQDERRARLMLEDDYYKAKYGLHHPTGQTDAWSATLLNHSHNQHGMREVTGKAVPQQSRPPQPAPRPPQQPCAYCKDCGGRR